MNTLTLPAHFDGKKMLLDEPYTLEPNTALLVTILPAPSSADNVEKEHQDWLRLSLQGLASAYGDDEPEYTSRDVKVWNPLYTGPRVF